MTRGLTCAAVVPVRGHAALLDGCLSALRAQGHDLSEVVVVDDSPDGSLEQLPGVQVVRSGGGGPYVARNVGARHTTADLLLFLDARSRPRLGWAAAMAAQFGDADVALAGTETLVAGGPSLAASVSQAQQFSRLRNYRGKPSVLPYLPTCNLAVRREDFDAVGGFSDVRSGGDADLCWRILGRPARRLSSVDEVFMDWLPRHRVRDLIEQNYRYGKGTHALRTTWAPSGVPQLDAWPHHRLVRRTARAVLRAVGACLRRDREGLVELLVASQQLSFQWGVRSAVDVSRRSGGRAPRPSAGVPC